MIILTVNPKKERREYRFSGGRVSIGSLPSGEGRLQLEKEQLKEEHVRIEQKGRGYFVYNVANDPFVALNEIPFGKCACKNGDELQVGRSVISVEIRQPPGEKGEGLSSSAPAIAADKPKGSASLQPAASDDTTLQEINRYLESLSLEEELPEEQNGAKGEGEELVDLDIETLLKEVEELDNPRGGREKGKSQSTAVPAAAVGEKGERENFEERAAHRQEERPLHQLAPLKFTGEEPKREKRGRSNQAVKWKMWTALILLFFATSALIFKGTYIQLKEASYRNEIEAAREVSDVALALTFAQINHVQPQQQNWSEPIFLSNSIRSVLTGNHKPYGTIDNRGRIVDGSYLLRIYNNHDMTRFIVIAQPEPSLSQWLVPQKAIVIDSTSMVLHRLRDLRPINRLLVNVNSLSGENGKAISDLIKAEEVLPLSSLADKHNQNGFAPPKQLELMRIGAENYAYNAPRYSQVGERLMEMAIDLVSRPASAQELKKLSEELKLVGKLPDVVIYTSKGMKAALKAQKALSTLLPDQNHLIGYLQFDERGNMKGSHLIFDLEGAKKGGGSGQFVELSSNKGGGEAESSYQPLLVAANAKEFIKGNTAPPNSYSFNPIVDRENTLFQRAESIAKERGKKLQESSSLLVEMIESNNRAYVENSQEGLQRVFTEYLKETERQNRLMEEKLSKLYEEFNQLPMSEFSEYIKAAGLPALRSSGSEKGKARSVLHSNRAVEEKYEEQLAVIGQSESFDELYDSVVEASNRLREKKVPDTAQLILKQNQLRSTVLQKLNLMLLSASHPLPRSELTDENRMRLSQILIYAWVSDPEEQEFYLTEFDKLREELR